jgi:chromosome partitioning protein
METSQPMKTIAILSQKGGSGKTTLALHLAVAATEAGKAAVVMDLDPQASATTWHAARKRAGYSDQPLVQPTHPAQIEAVLEACRAQGVDLVLIDTPPQSDNLATQAAQLADLVLITCKPSVMDLRAIQSTLRLTQIAGVDPYIVLTQIEPHGTRHAEAADTLKRLAVSVLPIGAGKRVAYMDALTDGQTATEFEPTGKAAEETRALLAEVMRRLKAAKKAKAA